jgi:hypothetical protein
VYDPVVGRFASVDPIVGNLGDSQSLNPYAYVGNRPHRAVDPSGLDFGCDPDFGCTTTPCGDFGCNPCDFVDCGGGGGGGGTRPPPPAPPATVVQQQSVEGPMPACGSSDFTAATCADNAVNVATRVGSAVGNADSASPAPQAPSIYVDVGVAATRGDTVLVYARPSATVAQVPPTTPLIILGGRAGPTVEPLVRPQTVAQGVRQALHGPKTGPKPPPAIAKPKPPTVNDILRGAQEAAKTYRTETRDPARFPLPPEATAPDDTLFGKATNLLDQVIKFLTHGSTMGSAGQETLPAAPNADDICPDPDLCMAYVVAPPQATSDQNDIPRMPAERLRAQSW